jgi:transposase-like protein
LTGGTTLAEFCRELDISPSVIRNWKRFAETGRPPRPRPVRGSDSMKYLLPQTLSNVIGPPDDLAPRCSLISQ